MIETTVRPKLSDALEKVRFFLLFPEFPPLPSLQHKEKEYYPSNLTSLLSGEKILRSLMMKYLLFWTFLFFSSLHSQEACQLGVRYRFC
jgi:hypothetical protein